MHNKRYENSLLLYFYGELENSEKQDFMRHLQECQECKDKLALLDKVTANLNEQQLNPPEEIVEKLTALTQKKQGFSLLNFVRKHFFNNFYKPAAALAGAALIAVVLNIYQKPSIDKNMWFGDLDGEMTLLSGQVARVEDYFAYNDGFISEEIDELNQMFESIEIDI